MKIDTCGVYCKTLWFHNVWEMDRFHSKLVSSGLEKHASLSNGVRTLRNCNVFIVLPAREKHSSLLRTLVNYDCKKSWKIGTCGLKNVNESLLCVIIIINSCLAQPHPSKKGTEKRWLSSCELIQYRIVLFVNETVRYEAYIKPFKNWILTIAFCSIPLSVSANFFVRFSWTRLNRKLPRYVSNLS